MEWRVVNGVIEAVEPVSGIPQQYSSQDEYMKSLDTIVKGHREVADLVKRMLNN